MRSRWNFFSASSTSIRATQWLKAIWDRPLLLGQKRRGAATLRRALSLDPTLENVRANREGVLKAMEATQD